MQMDPAPHEVEQQEVAEAAPAEPGLFRLGSDLSFDILRRRKESHDPSFDQRQLNSAKFQSNESLALRSEVSFGGMANGSHQQ